MDHKALTLMGKKPTGCSIAASGSFFLRLPKPHGIAVSVGTSPEMAQRLKKS